MGIWLTTGIAIALLAGPASAESRFSPSEASRAIAADECPLLTQIKYPWLACETRAPGTRSITTVTVPAEASWARNRSLPIGDDWVEGEGAWQTP